MDIITLKNDELKVEINLKGAEIFSAKDLDTSIEYIWKSDPKVWNRHAPVLFPIVGKLKDNHYFVDNKDYEMGQHGFARDMKFKIAEKGSEYVSFVLKSSDETLKKYPFDFEFYVNYTLHNRSVLVNYQVVNPVDKELYFSVGAHPGFTIPITNDTKYEDYYIELTPNKERLRIPLINSNIDIDNHFKVKEHKFNINHELFKNDALIFELSGSNDISIKSDKTSFGISVSSDNAEYVGLWSSYPTEGNFVCVEPWWGIADTVDANGDFKNKFAIKKLNNKNDEFNANYTITFNK